MLSRLILGKEICRLENFPKPHFFTTQAAGNMSSDYGDEEEASDNFKKCFRAGMRRGLNRVLMLPQDSDEIVSLSLHQSSVVEIKCDGLITSSPSIALTMLSADCLPVLMTDSDKSFIGLIHAGWRGTDKEIVRKAVELAIREYDLKAGDIFVGIGPGIHKCCYDNEIAAKELSADERWKPFITDGSFGVRIDLLDFNVRQLLEAGIRREHITIASECTCCAKDKNTGEYLFFSHYRVKKTNEPEGRFAAVISML